MTVKVDLLPSERKRPKVFDGLTVVLILLLIAVVGGLVWYSKQLDGEIQDRKDKIAALQKEIEQLAPLKLKIDQYKQLTQSIKQQVQLLKSLRDDPRNYSLLIDEVKKIIPKNVWIGNLDISPSAKTFKCNCTALAVEKDGLETVALFMRNVSNSPTFSNPTVTSVSRKKEDNFIVYSFSMQGNYVLPGGGGAQ
jgi:Tfp pilus assembly protein PilN